VPVGPHVCVKCVCDPNKYLDVPGESTDVHKEVIAYNYNGNLNQMWLLTPVDQNHYSIQSASSNFVLELQGGIDA
jgi:hypothetical protein